MLPGGLFAGAGMGARATNDLAQEFQRVANTALLPQ